MDSGVSVSSSNNTHNGCVRVAPIANQHYTERQSITTTSTNFTDDTFTNCSGGENNGGALYLSGTSIVAVIYGCTFTNCSVTTTEYWCGAFYAYVKSIQTVNSSIINCTAKYAGGACPYSVTECVSFRLCVIEGCHSYYYGGGVYFRICPPGDMTCHSGGNITDPPAGQGSALSVECSFTDCSTTATGSYEYGGGGANWYVAPNATLHQSCIFRQCSAAQYGGALNMFRVSKAGSPTKLVCDSFFDRNDLTHNTIKNGVDI